MQAVLPVLTRRVGRPHRRKWIAMKSFARALREAWRHWPALGLALACSIGVAALWGANIAAIFPIIETTLHGKSLQQWNRDRLEASQDKLAAHESQIPELRQKI